MQAKTVTQPGFCVLGIEEAGLADASAVLALQKLAYSGEAAIYNDLSIPPLVQTLPQMEADFGRQRFLKATFGGEIVGSVRAHVEAGACYIGRLIVHPDHQNRGLGARLMHAIEACYPDALRFELFTGHLSARNLYLYDKLGYREFRRQALTDLVDLIFLEKPGPAAHGQPPPDP